MLEVYKKGPSVLAETGLVSTFYFNVGKTPFLMVDKYSEPHPGHRTKWPTMLDTSEGLQFILWAEAEFLKYFTSKGKREVGTLKFEPRILDESITESLTDRGFKSFSASSSEKFGQTIFTYGAREEMDARYPFNGFRYIEISSKFNLADFVSNLLPVGCYVSDLPLTAVHRRLNSIYRNCPKP